MSEHYDYYHRWEPLAEFYFNLHNEDEDLFEDDFIYCLCSRVLTRETIKTYEEEKYNGSESDIDAAPEAPSSEVEDHSHVHFSVDTSYKVKCDKDDAASCYCSASHTDNYCSTDEHDIGQSIPSNVLQPSDSGADLTYQDYIIHDTIEKNFPQDVSKLENFEDYMSKDTWEEFWAVHGERIIWASWIKKYSDYINPDYFDENNDLLLDENNIPQKCETKLDLIRDNDKSSDNIRERKYSYDSKIKPNSKDETLLEKQGKKCKILTDTKDDTWVAIGRRRSSSEHERILSPKTLAATDSMTNVTKATLSSYNVTSSHVTSNSTPTDDYSVSSSTSDDQINDQTRIANVDESDQVLSEEFDNDMYWQHLWKNHFGEQYALHYSYFMESHNIHNKEVETDTDKIVDYKTDDSQAISKKCANIERNSEDLFLINEVDTVNDNNKKNKTNMKHKSIELEKVMENRETDVQNLSCNDSTSSVNTKLQNLLIEPNDSLIEELCFQQPELSKIYNCETITGNPTEGKCKKEELIFTNTDCVNNEDNSQDISQFEGIIIKSKRSRRKKNKMLQNEYKTANSISAVLQRLHNEQKEKECKESIDSIHEKKCSEEVVVTDSKLDSTTIALKTNEYANDHNSNFMKEGSNYEDMESENSEECSKNLPSIIEVKCSTEKEKNRKNAGPKKVDPDKVLRDRKRSIKNQKEYNQANSMSALLQRLLNEQNNTELQAQTDAGDEKVTSEPVDPIENDNSVNSTTIIANTEAHIQANNKNTNNEDQNEDDDPPEETSYSLKRSHELDADEIMTERIKATFEIMGFTQNSTKMPKGELIYKKKNSKLRPPRSRRWTTPRKTYFDDDGNSYEKGETECYSGDEGPEEIEEENINVESSTINEENKEDYNIENKQEDSADNLVDRVDVVEHSSNGQSDPDSKLCDIRNEDVTTDIVQIQNDTKRRRRLKRHLRQEESDTCDLPEELQGEPKMLKYWKKRHSLFHRFDEGIRLDVESWFSVTPENVAAHIADRCAHDVMLDAFCGAGGNAIQFARTCKKVIAVDIDPKKIELARHNAAVYGVTNIEFIVGDFFEVAPTLAADYVFLSPPWGGPKYSESFEYDIETMLEPKPASELVSVASQISSKMALYLPRNSKANQIISLAQDLGESVEIEQSFLDRRFVAITAYFY